LCCRKTGGSHQEICQPPKWPEGGPRRQSQTQRRRREPEAGKTENTPEEHHDAQDARTETGFQRILSESDSVAKLSESKLHGLSEDHEETRQGIP